LVKDAYVRDNKLGVVITRHNPNEAKPSEVLVRFHKIFRTKT